jgi:hypothetical protein
VGESLVPSYRATILLLANHSTAGKPFCCWQAILLLASHSAAGKPFCCWQTILLLASHSAATGKTFFY